MSPIAPSPDISVPSTWQSPLPDGTNSEPLGFFLWWENLNDPILTCLIENAVSQNLDLKLALTRILEVRVEKQGKHANLYPHLDASVNYDHVYYSKKALVNSLLGTALPVKSNLKHRDINFFEVGFDVEWEIDLFGFHAHEMSAMQASEQAAEHNLCDVWVTLSAEIARSYVELRAQQQKLKTVTAKIANQKQSIQLIQDLVDSGVVEETEVNQSRIQLNTWAGEKPLIEGMIRKSLNHLATLLGHYPGELDHQLLLSDSFPCLPYQNPIGVPSELLRRRPDIRKAERELASATERVESAIASLFPRFSLRGFIGDISTKAGSLFHPASFTWFAGPQLLFPIFNSKLIVQSINYNKIQTKKAIYEYQKTTLTALEEAENSIASFHFELERNQHLVESHKIAQQNFEWTFELSQMGIKDRLTTLATFNALITAEEMLSQSRTDLLLSYISLYKALGGSWWDEEEPCE